ncbi:hypothetical protein CJU94_02020 [Paraburkholderia aromaticivorans]|uniref:histidine kinase n=2 Tax=Paraburkholderia aromaticivorans TaxID=2026199 RepID=A0A248VDY9_9BURK|nr:hypothetical protein CJU94_02020 [Paraburkholderia aromaticivorans]
MGREMGIKMSAYLASTEPSSGGSALNGLIVTDAIMNRGCRAAESGFVADACAAGQRIDAPALSNEVLAMVAHELRAPLMPLRMASQLIRSASAERPEILRLI